MTEVYRPPRTVIKPRQATCTDHDLMIDNDHALGNNTAPPPEGARRELIEAKRAIAATGVAPADQAPSMGCSIKWKAA